MYKVWVNTALSYMAALKIAITQQQISHIPRKKQLLLFFCRQSFCSEWFNVVLNEGKSIHCRGEAAVAPYEFKDPNALQYP